MRISNFQFVQILWDLQLTNMGFLQLCQQRLVPKYNLKVQVKELLIKVLHHIIFHFKVYLIKTKTGILDVIIVIDVKNFFLIQLKCVAHKWVGDKEMLQSKNDFEKTWVRMDRRFLSHAKKIVLLEMEKIDSLMSFSSFQC